MKQPDDKQPPSWRKLFPLVDKSPAIQDLVRAAQACARNSWFIPVVVPPADRLELRAFFLRVMGAMGAKGMHERIRVINDHPPERAELEHSEPTSLLFLKGEDIPEYAQWEILHKRFNFPLVMLALEADEWDRPSAALRLSRTFLEACSPQILYWPAWGRRAVDHAEIIAQIRDRLSMPQGKEVPDFHPSAVDFLFSMPFEGTGHAEREIKAALQRYIQQGDSGPLTARHFTVFDGLTTLSSHKSVPPLSVAR